MPALLDAFGHSRHSYVLGDHEHMDGNEVTSRQGLINEPKLRRMRENGFGSELRAVLDESGSRRLCNLGGIVSMALRILRPAFDGNQIGVNEQNAR